MPLPKCATFSRRVASLGKKYENGVYSAFKKSFDFLSSEKGPHLTTYKSLEASEKLVGISPRAVDNFITAFKYGSSKKGLSLDIKDAYGFANNLAVKTRWIASEPKSETGKAPAK